MNIRQNHKNRMSLSTIDEKIVQERMRTNSFSVTKNYFENQSHPVPAKREAGQPSLGSSPAQDQASVKTTSVEEIYVEVPLTKSVAKKSGSSSSILKLFKKSKQKEQETV